MNKESADLTTSLKVINRRLQEIAIDLTESEFIIYNKRFLTGFLGSKIGIFFVTFLKRHNALLAVAKRILGR